MAKAKYEGPADSLLRYEALVARHPGVDRKGAKTPYTSRNGHMFSFLDPTGMLALRLPAALRDEFLDSNDSWIVEQHGRMMAEYVAVPDALFEDAAEMNRWFAASVDWIGSLKPKATKRPKKSK